MRRIIGLGMLAGVVAFAVAQVSGTGLLSNFAKSINAASSLSATYTVTAIGQGGAEAYGIDLKKPNMARIDTPTQLIVADGKTVYTLDKKENSYFKQPQTADILQGAFTSDETSVWAGFFNSSAYKPVSTKSLGAKNRKGMTLNAVEATYDTGGRRVVTYFLDPSDNVARQAQLDMNDPSGKATSILTTKDLTLGKEISPDKFIFTPPAGSKEVSLEDMNAGKWYTDFKEACALAKKTKRLVMVDFQTDWCHWCRVLEKEVYTTDEFKKQSKFFVFCKIDAEKGEGIDLAARYKISAYPICKFIKPDGTEVHESVGYKPTAAFIAEMNTAKSKGGM